MTSNIIHKCLNIFTSEAIGFGYFKLKVPLVIVTEYYSLADNMIVYCCVVFWGLFAIGHI